MKKRMLAAAVAVAMAAPGAAQAATKVSGIMDLSLNFIDNDDSAATANQDGSSQYISSNNSRLIFKGSEDLGAGLKAIWQIGNVIAVDGGGTTLNQRNTFLGLAGEWGQVRIGRHEAPYKMVGRKVDLFYNRQLGENRILVTPNSANSPSPQFSQDKRPSEGLHYFTPAFNGFQAAGAYIPAEGVDDGDGYSLAAFYDNGPIYVGAGYERFNKGHFPAGPPGILEDTVGYRLAGSYKFPMGVRVIGLYQFVKDDTGRRGNNWEVWGLGASYSFGNNVVKAQYFDRDGQDSIKDQDADAFSIGFDHKLSKRTMLYATYATVDNDRGASFTVDSQGFNQGPNSNGTGVGPGDDSAGFALGVSHKF